MILKFDLVSLAAAYFKEAGCPEFISLQIHRQRLWLSSSDGSSCRGLFTAQVDLKFLLHATIGLGLANGPKTGPVGLHV